MKIIDWNIHLYDKTPNNLNVGITKDTELLAKDLIANFNRFLPHFNHTKISGGNFMLFNHEVIHDPLLPEFFYVVRRALPESVFCILFNFRKENFEEELKKVAELGFHSIKFHAYVQSINMSEHSIISRIALRAEQLGLAINLDTSYGSTKMFRNDPLALAADILEVVKKSPVVLLHSGGLRMMEAMLLADLCPNVYLETSLSIVFYKDFRIIDDFFAVYRRIGTERVLFASDFPYQPVDEAIALQTHLFSKNGFSKEEQKRIFSGNAERLFKK